MELAEVERIVAGGESEMAELKKSTAQITRTGEVLCAFLNGEGGRVFIGITPDGRILGQPSKPRSPYLTNIFYRRGLIEQWGRGANRIVELTVQAGHPEPEFAEIAGSVVVRFRPKTGTVSRPAVLRLDGSSAGIRRRPRRDSDSTPRLDG